LEMVDTLFKVSIRIDVGSATSANSNHQLWRIEKDNDNYFLKPMHCLSRALDKRPGTGGKNLIFSFNRTNGNQQFELIPVSSSSACQLHDSEDFESGLGIWNDGLWAEIIHIYGCDRF